MQDLLTPEEMFSRDAGFVYIKPLYSHVLVIGSVWKTVFGT